MERDLTAGRTETGPLTEVDITDVSSERQQTAEIATANRTVAETVIANGNQSDTFDEKQTHQAIEVNETEIARSGNYQLSPN